MSNIKLESAQSFMKSADNKGFARGFSSGLALRAVSLLAVLASVYGAQGYEPTVIGSKTIRVYDNLTKRFADYTIRANGDVEVFVVKPLSHNFCDNKIPPYYASNTTYFSKLIPSGAVLMSDLTEDLKALQDNNYQGLDQPKVDPLIASALAILALGSIQPNTNLDPFSMSGEATDFEDFLNKLLKLG